MKRHTIILTTALILAATVAGAGFPNTTREFSGVSLEQVTGLLEHSLEVRRFQVVDVDRQPDGDVIVETSRVGFYGPFRQTYHLWVVPGGRVRVIVDTLCPKNDYNKKVWSDLERAVVDTGGAAYCFTRSGEETVCGGGE